MKTSTIILVMGAILFGGCQLSSKKLKESKMNTKGTYAYDKAFMENHTNVIELKAEKAAVLLAPDYQGRVMTSTCDGDQGFSFGWINYDLIQSNKMVEHFNPFGGEERFWLGPEGGQFSIYFQKDKSFDFENWYVPAAIDTEAFQVVSSSPNKAIFERTMALKNYSGTAFNLKVSRKVSLIPEDEISSILGVELKNTSVVAYQSDNSVLNSGDQAWDKKSGLLSIWMLGMMTPSPNVTVVIPVKSGDEGELGVKVNDDYFGKVSGDRLKVIDNHVFFKADGKSRGKIGIPPLRANRFMGSYDGKNSTLTILDCSLPEGVTDYVNSAWELQENPYGGDAFNSYNDGPLEDGSQMGPFYELESSSPALALKAGQSYTHSQRTYHFKAGKKELDLIAQKVLGVSITDIESVF